jgi:ABC-type transporter Mla subunit MlaD
MAKDVDVRVKATVEGAESIQKTTDSLDKMADAGGNAGKAVASTTKSTTNFSDLLGKLPGPLGGAASGIMSMTKAALQFLATPIGAVIGAIGIILAAFTKAIKNSDQAMDSLSEITATFSGIVRPVFEFLEKVAVKVLGAVADGLEVVANLFGSSGAAARQMAKDLDKLEETEMQLNKERAQANAKIAEAKEIMSDSNATIEERRKALEKVKIAEEELAGKEVRNAYERRHLAQLAIQQEGESLFLKQKLNEAEIQFFQTLQAQAAQQRQFSKS